MSSFIDVRKLNDLNIVKKANSAFLDFFGLKLSFYPLNNNNVTGSFNYDEIDKLICPSANKDKCKRLMVKDIKKAFNKREVTIHNCSPKTKQLIIPIMACKKVYGLTFAAGIENIKTKDIPQKGRLRQDKNSRTKSEKEWQLTFTSDVKKLKQLGTFLSSFINYIFTSRFDEMAFLNSELSQTHLQESINRAIGYIKENYYRPNVSLTEVSEAINLSPYYFSHQFKKEYHTTFIEYLTNTRLEASAKLLKDFRLSVAQISFAVGYQDPNYFSKVFKKWMNITPQEYRDEIVNQKTL